MPQTDEDPESVIQALREENIALRACLAEATRVMQRATATMKEAAERMRADNDKRE